MTLKYPLDLEEPVVDYMVFTAHEYRTNKKYQGQQAGNEGGGEGPQKGEPIVLYMPNSTPAAGNAQGWDENRNEGPLGMMARNLAMGASGGIMNANLNEDGYTQGKKLINGIVAQFNANKNKVGPAVKQVLVGAVGQMAGTNASGLLAMQRGQVYNPNVELLYQSPALRTFSFDFVFIPKNRMEADAMNRIILEFKKWSSPADNQNGLFEVPCIWKIQYMTGGQKNKNMNQFKKCALTGISVQANAGTNMHQAFDEGMPITTSMSLNFQEVDIIVRGDHEKALNQGY
jgi:hypothetical protein